MSVYLLVLEEHNNVLEISPLVSLISLVSLWYFTEKRFVILKLASYIAEELETSDSGFEWQRYLKGQTKEGSQSEIRPYRYVYPFTC